MLARPPSLLGAIAREVGVSKSTVSSVLNGRYRERRISERVASMVLEASRRIDQRPNAAARAVQSGRHGTIGLVSSSEGERVSPFLHLWRGAMIEAASRDVNLALAPLPDELSVEQELPRLVREDFTDGLIIDLIHDIPPSFTQAIERHRIPAVFANAKLEHNCVYPNDRLAAREASERLLALGHRRICFFGFGWQVHYSDAERRAGYREALERAGLVPFEVSDVPLLQLEQADALRAIFADNWPTAVVAYSPTEAIVVARAAELSGLRVPHDVSIVTFADTLEHWRFLAALGVVSMLVPSLDVGRLAVSTLCHLLLQPERTMSPVVVPFEGIAGELAPPRGLSPLLS